MTDTNELIRQSVARVAAMTPLERAEMLRAQRESMVVGEAGFGSDADEAEYRAALAADDKPTLARLDQEAKIRMDNARKFLRETGR